MNLNDPQRCAQQTGLHLLFKTITCYNWDTRDLEGVIFDAPNEGNRLSNGFGALKKIDYIRIESFLV